jgi:6-phosphogluconate dehydrogenase
MSSNSPSSNTIAMIGLGRMGANMARRMARAGVQVHGFDAAETSRQALATETNVSLHLSLAAAVAALPTPRTVWIMLPAGEITESALQELSHLLSPNDLIIEGGNANYQDSQKRAAALAAHQIEFADCGVSGGVWGLQNGYCLMFGGSANAAAQMRPFVDALAPGGGSTPSESGWVHCGPVGSGHFAKMIHNGVEYAMMQSFAEGFALMQNKTDFNFDLAAVGEAWKHGSVVRSWLLDLTVDALKDPQSIAQVEPFVADSGEGRWTVDESIRQGTPAPVIALSVMQRFTSQGKADYGNKLLAMMRKGFGGHAVKPKA